MLKDEPLPSDVVGDGRMFGEHLVAPLDKAFSALKDSENHAGREEA